MTSPERLPSGAKSKRTPANLTRQNRVPIRLLLAIVAVGALVIGLAAYNSLSGADQHGLAYEVGQPGPGDAAPDFTVANVDGTSFHFAASRGKQVLLFFHEGLGCDPCWRQIDALQADLAQFKSLGIDEVVAISADSASAQAARAQRTGITLPTLADPDRAVSNAYGTLAYGMMNGALPGHSFILVGADGRIRWRADYGGPPNYTMYVPDATLLAELRRALGISG